MEIYYSSRQPESFQSNHILTFVDDRSGVNSVRTLAAVLRHEEA